MFNELSSKQLHVPESAHLQAHRMKVNQIRAQRYVSAIEKKPAANLLSQHRSDL